MRDTHIGSCFCGGVAIKVTGYPQEMGYCHCNACRSYSGAPLRAFTLWKQDNVMVVRGRELLGCFEASEVTERCFCTQCGGDVMSHHPQLGFTDIAPAVIPTVVFKPSVHLNYEESVLPIKDGLVKLKDFPTAVGGSGETIPE